MLYNPAWRDPAPLTLPKLIAWLEHQPAAQEYCYKSTGECLLAQYLTAQGYIDPLVGASQWACRPAIGSNWGDFQPFPPGFDDIAIGNPRTFGDAMARARAALADAKMTPAKEPVS